MRATAVSGVASPELLRHRGRAVVFDSDAGARVAMWSTVVVPTGTAYPDSDKVALWTGLEGENVMVTRSSHVAYYHGETG